MKIKAVIKEIPRGTKFDVYKKFICFWIHDYGLIPLVYGTYLIDKEIERLKKLYGDDFIIKDFRNHE